MSTTRGISGASASRIVVAAVLSLIVTGAATYLGLQFSHNYTASVGLLGVLSSNPDDAQPAAMSGELPWIAQAALTDDAFAEIDRRAHPYSFVATKFFPNWTAARLRSQLSVENIYSGTTMGAIALVYSGNDRQAALAVTTAAADLLVQPRDAVPLAPAVAPPSAVQKASVKSNETPTAEAPPPATAVPPVTPEADAAQMKAIRELRAQLAAIARNSQDMQNQIQSVSESLAAIEQEKEHLRQAVLVVPPAPKPIPPPPDPKRTLLQSKLSSYDKVLAALRDRYTEDYPDVINARERVEELQAEIAQLPRPVAPVERKEPPKAASDMPLRLAVLDERERPIQASLDEMRGKLKAGEAKAAQLRRLLTELPAKAEAARIAAATVPPVAAPPPRQPVTAPHATSGKTPGPASGDGIPVEPRFSIVAPAEIRKTEEILSAESIAMVSIACGLGVGFAYLALGSRRGSRRPREEAEPEAAAV
jgi:hypothetical protein